MADRRWGALVRLVGLALGTVAAGLLLAACHGLPHDLLVTTTADGPDADPGDGVCEMTTGAGDCSLRAAIDEASASGSNEIALPAGTYPLTVAGADDDNAGGDLDVSAPGRTITIRGRGPGGARIDADGADRVLEVHAGTVTLLDVAAVGAAGDGLAARSGTTLALARSAVVANGGTGIVVDGGATATVGAATVSGNGGAGISGAGTVELSWTTVTANGAGGVDATGTVAATGSVVADQTAGADCSAAIASGGHNLDGDGSCGLADATDLPSGAAALGALSSDTVPAHEPTAGSDALESAGTACAADLGGIDQRSAPRPAGSGCERGAVEVQPTSGPAVELTVTSAADEGDSAPGDGACTAGAPAAPATAAEPPPTTTTTGPSTTTTTAGTDTSEPTSTTSTTAAGTDASEPSSTTTTTAGDADATDPSTGGPGTDATTTTTAPTSTTTTARAPTATTAPPATRASGECTLRAAIQEANALAVATPGQRTIVHLLAGTVHPLTLGAGAGDEDGAAAGDLDVRSDVELRGDGATISAADLGPGPDHRVLDVHPGGRLTLVDVGVTGGHPDGDGGGIRVVAGSLVTEGATVWANHAGGTGGGIAWQPTAAPACRAAGCSLTTSTVTDNSAVTGGGLATSAPVALAWTTVVGNVATDPAGAGGIRAGDLVVLTGALVDGVDGAACEGLVLAEAASVASDDTCGGALAVDGELTWPVEAAGDGAAAPPVPDPTWRVEQALIDAGAGTTSCPSTDQLGRDRPRGPTCDAGAVEGIDIVATSVHDEVDATPGDGTCDGEHGLCTLRAAVALANARPGLDRVVLTPDLRYELSRFRDDADDAGTGDLDVTDDLVIAGQGAVIDGGWRPDDTLPEPGTATLMGVVTDDVTGAPLEGIEVLINTDGVWGPLKATTDHNGWYRITGLDPTAVNKARFNDYSGQYLREYWDDVRPTASASPLPLTADAITTIDAGMAPDPAAPPVDPPGPVRDVWGAHDRVLEVTGGATLTLDHVEVTGGYTSGDGGGVLVGDGALVADRSTIQRNRAVGLGGGVHVADPGTAVLRQATVSNNQAADGSGVATTSTAPLVLDWTTVAENGAYGAGAGLHLAGPTTLRGSLLGYHRDLDRADGVAPDCSLVGAPTITVEEVNLDTWVDGGAGTCGLPPAMTIDPAVHGRLLLPLDQLVGQTPTHGLVPQAEDIVAGTIGVATGACPATDQRDQPRNRVRPDLAVAHPDLCEPGAVEFAPWLFVDHDDDQADGTADGACTPDPVVDGCRLRAAVQEANRYPGPDVIVLHDGIDADLTLAGADEDAAATGDLDVTEDLVIRGAGATVDASGLGDRVFQVRDGATLTLSQLDLVGGGAVATGGVVDVDQGSLHVERSSLVGGSAGEGGAIRFGPDSSGGSVRHSTLSGGTATDGAGLATRSPAPVELRWSTVAAGAATGQGGGLLVGGPLTTEGNLVAAPTAGAGCALDGGAVTSRGWSALPEASCAGPEDLVVAGAAVGPLGEHGGPTRTHEPSTGTLVDLVPTDACPERDQQGVHRPQGGACEPGGLEVVTSGSTFELVAFTTPAGPRGVDELPEDSDGARFPRLEPDVTYVHASDVAAHHYLGDEARADRAFEALLTRNFPAFKDPATPYPRRNWGEFAFPQILRLELIEQPASWLTNRYRPLLQAWGAQYAAQECDLAGDFGSATDPDPWYRPFDDSENLALMRRGSCLLTTWAYGAPGEWQPWARANAAALAARARTGVLEEFNSPTYGQHSIAAVLNLVDFPGQDPGTDDELVRDTARQYLDLTFHVFAHEYNPTTGVGGLSGVRMFQPDPRDLDPDENGPGDDYVFPSEGWVNDWMRLYGWAPRVHPPPRSTRLALNGAVSSYRPLDISRQLGVDPDKSFAAAISRPGLTTVPAIDAQHEIRQWLDVQPTYMLGAQTYGPGAGLHHMGQNRWFTAAFDGSERDRVVVSGVADLQAGRADLFSDGFAVNGFVHDGVLVALPDTRATNVVGPDQRIRAYLGSLDLRANLVVGADGWFLTHDGPAGDSSAADVFVAIHTSGTPVVVCDELDQAEPCSDPSLRREIRSDAAIVVQVVPAAELDDGDPGTDDFADVFVPTFPVGRWTGPGAGETASELRSWAGDTFRFEPEWDEYADIELNGVPVDASAPTRAYDSPWFCDLDPDPASPQIIGLRGPGQATCETVLDFG